MCLKPLLYLCFTPINIPILSIVNTLLHHVIVSSYREFYHDIIYIRLYLPFNILYYLHQVLPSSFTLGFNLPPLLYPTLLYYLPYITLYYTTTLYTIIHYPTLHYITIHYYTIPHYVHIAYNKTTLVYKVILLPLQNTLHYNQFLLSIYTSATSKHSVLLYLQLCLFQLHVNPQCMPSALQRTECKLLLATVRYNLVGMPVRLS